MFKLIGEIVVVYILYQIIFNFIIPLYRASKKMKGTFSDMQEKMKEKQNATNQTHFEAQKKKPTQTASGDYIDYEEVKE